MPGRRGRGGGHAGQVRRNCRVRRQFRTKKFLVPPQTGRNAIEGKYPSIQLPVLPVHMTRRAGVYLSEKVVCQTYHPPNHAWASQLGEPVLSWASQLGEPSNEVGASHQTRLGEPSNEVGRATRWPLGEPLNHSGLHACFKAAPWRSYGASSARARSAHLLSARSALHPLHGASSAPG